MDLSIGLSLEPDNESFDLTEDQFKELGSGIEQWFSETWETIEKHSLRTVDRITGHLYGALADGAGAVKDTVSDTMGDAFSAVMEGDLDKAADAVDAFGEY